MGGGMPLREESREAEATGYSPSQVSRIPWFPDFQQLYDAASIEVAMVRGSMSGPPEEFSQSYLVLLFDTL